MHDAAGERAVGAGRSARCTSACSAVPVRYGSTTTSLAPRSFLARATWVITLTWVFTGLLPQITIRSECTDLLADHAPAPAVAGAPADVGERHADRGVPARVAHGVAQAVDAVALHEAHGAGVEVRPDGLRAVLLRLAHERFGDLVERIVPGDRRERARALRADPAQRLRQPLGVVEALGVARDLRADHARGVGVALRAPDLAQAPAVQALDLERAHRGAVVRTDGRQQRGGHRHFLATLAGYIIPALTGMTRVRTHDKPGRREYEGARGRPASHCSPGSNLSW